MNEFFAATFYDFFQMQQKQYFSFVKCNIIDILLRSNNISSKLQVHYAIL